MSSQSITEAPKFKPAKLPARNKKPKASVLEAVLFCSGRSWRCSISGINFWEFEVKDLVPLDYVNQPLEIVFVHRVGKEKKLYLFQGVSQNAPFRSNKIKFYGLAQVQIQKLSELIRDLKH